MTTISTGGRTLAIVAGAAFTFGGLRIILGDTLTDPAQWTTSVQLTMLTVFGTIAAGHLMRDAARARHLFASLGFLVLFLSGTGLVVYNSVGRQAEATMMTEDQVIDVAELKAALKADLKLNNDMAKEARKKLGKECDTGDGTACKGKRATLKVYEDAVAGVEAKLAALGPQKPVHAKSSEMAKVAALFGADEAKAKAALMLLEPFLWTLFFEIGSIVSLGFAFRHRPATQKQAATQKPAIQETVAERAPLMPSEQSDFGGDDIDVARQLGIGGKSGAGNWGNPGNGGGKRVFSKAEALFDLTRRLASGETVPSQDVLAKAWGVDKSTVSKWLRKWREDDKIPAAQRVGRCHRLVTAE